MMIILILATIIGLSISIPLSIWLDNQVAKESHPYIYIDIKNLNPEPRPIRNPFKKNKQKETIMYEQD